MLGILKKKSPTQVDCQEAYNLWDALVSRYNTIQQMIMELMDKQANKIEQLMNDYQLALPKRPPQNIKTPANIEAYEDRFLVAVV